ncbi:MAG: exo-alpha-sialidase [Planctomycetes bacterium]|nr:exo-alpha-sialidase [Planctomycetota bacterium]MBI3835342.1 exo-alpha-sialidase [Planctomycetota bacterium]
MPWIKPVRVSTQNVAGNHAPCASHVTRDGYTSIQVNVDAYGCNIPGDAANEPSIVIDPTDLKKMAIGWRQFDSVLSDFRQAGWAYSHDAGHTWVFHGSLTPCVFGSDPVLTSNAEGEMYYVSINDSETRLFRSLDRGVTWPAVTQVTDYFADKPWITVDKTLGVGHGNVYVVTPLSSFQRSTDSGDSFFSYDAQWGNGNTLDVGVDGCVWVAAHGNGDTEVDVTVSCNAQDPSAEPAFSLSGTIRLSMFPVGCNVNGIGLFAQPWIVTDHSTTNLRGNIYVCTAGPSNPDNSLPGPASVVFIRSSNHGKTWDGPILVNDEPPSGNACQWFPMISVASNGRIDAVWNDTRTYGTSRLTELRYSSSSDGGETWSPSVGVSPLFGASIGYPSNNPKLGDYYHMLSDNLGVNVAYAATFNDEQDIYFLRIGPWDCNGNQIDDTEDIGSATSFDCNGNGVPDECEYRADFDGDGLTTYNDFATFLGNFTGPIVRETASAPRERDGSGTNCSVLSDIDHDGDVDLKDFYGLQQVFVTP